MMKDVLLVVKGDAQTGEVAKLEWPKDVPASPTAKANILEAVADKATKAAKRELKKADQPY
jgi:hypothetical protein